MRLVADGHEVVASVKSWPQPAHQITELTSSGVMVHSRVEKYGVAKRIVNKLTSKVGLGASFSATAVLRNLLSEIQPDLLVVSQGGISDGLIAMELALELGIPYVSLIQANSESFWPNDALADRLLNASSNARRNYFVSKANQDLFFRQIGKRLDNCITVHNPPNQTAVGDESWPETDVELSLACVARLEPAAKGQDILFEVLAQPAWRKRSIRVHLYGSGACSKSLKRYANSLEITSKVVFEGQVNNVGDIWRRHHALVLPSRYEGTPLSLIEAMRCARPAIATAVAGIPELIDDGVNGFLAIAPAIPLFEECMERAWKKRHEFKEMGLSAKQTIESKLPDDPLKSFVDELFDASDH